MTSDELRDLARSRGVELAYHGVDGVRHEASDESLAAIVRALDPAALKRPEVGAPASVGDDKVIVVWDGRWREPIVLAGDSERMEWTLTDETGAVLRGAVSGRAVEDDDQSALVAFGPPVARLAAGYHQLATRRVVDLHGVSTVVRSDFLVISAPRRAFALPGERLLGVWTPLIALRGEDDWGSGTIAELTELGQALGGNGCRILGTLPLYAAFSERGHTEVSPYRPISRRFWNELFLSLRELPEWSAIAELAGAVDARELGGPLADPEATTAIKRPLLEAALAGMAPQRQNELAAHRAAHPLLEEYARFRAAVETLGSNWHVWPEPARSGDLSGADLPAKAIDYHVYVQWCMASQLSTMRQRLAQHGVVTYLDLPIGVHPDGFDAWREQELFVPGMSLGAPPDALAAQGQDWGFQPLHPERIRERGYRYLRECFSELMRYAGGVRIDHVLGLHRQFWVPSELGGEAGVYVRVRADELYALLLVESHRAEALLVGEDLGNVPPGVHEAMDEHGLARSFVGQFCFQDQADDVLPWPPANALATLNTHDTPTFRGFLEGGDVELRRDFGIATAEAAARELGERRELRAALVDFVRRAGLGDPEDWDSIAIADALLRRLASSEAQIVLASLDDLLGEATPFNVPGTTTEYPNWRRRARLTVSEIAADPRIAASLRDAAAARGSHYPC